MKITVFIITWFFFGGLSAKISKLDSLLLTQKNLKKDSTYALNLFEISEELNSQGQYDASIVYAKKCLQFAERIDYPKGIAKGLIALSGNYVRKKNAPRALRYIFKAYEITQKNKSLFAENQKILVSTAFIYTSIDDYQNAVVYRKKHIFSIHNLLKSKQYKILHKERLHEDSTNLAQSYSSLSFYYFQLKNYELSKKYGYTSLYLLNKIKKVDSSYHAYILVVIGAIERLKGNFENGLKILHRSLAYSNASQIPKNKLTTSYKCQWELAIIKNAQHEIDSSIYFAENALGLCKKLKWIKDEVPITELLAEDYSYNDIYKSNLLFKKAICLNKVLNDKSQQDKLDRISAEEKERQIELIEKYTMEQEIIQTRIQYAAIGLTILCTFIIFLLLSKLVIKNQKVISFLTSLSILFIFEFFNLVSSPLIGQLTMNIPYVSFITAVTLALVLSPLHDLLNNFLERKLNKK
jgi:hypothetical protein